MIIVLFHKSYSNDLLQKMCKRSVDIFYIHDYSICMLLLFEVNIGPFLPWKGHSLLLLEIN